MTLIQHNCLVIVPLIISGILHMILVKNDLFPASKVPFSKKLFGVNKTWRGLIFVGLMNGLVTLIFHYLFSWPVKHPFLIGALLGGAYIIFELPNSFLKRRLGIGPGESSKKNKLLHNLLDKSDSSFGVSLVYYLAGYADWRMALYIFLIGVLVHVGISMLLVNTKIKKSF